MPLYVCSRCHAIENTALGNYWDTKINTGDEPLCSECETGEWHGKFPKTIATSEYLAKNAEQFVDMGPLTPISYKYKLKRRR